MDMDAKSSMPTSLPALAGKGWTILPAALLGTVGKPPLWTQDGFRPVLGTTIDSRIVPGPFLQKRNPYCLVAGGLYVTRHSLPAGTLSSKAMT